MKFKLLTLLLGVPLVAFGSRMVADSLTHGWLPGVEGMLLFLVGQSIVRFEDFPHSKDKLMQLAARFSKKSQANNIAPSI